MIHWGILGTAQIARACIIPAILKSGNGILHAVASRDLHRAELLVHKHQQGIAYQGYDQLLEDPEVDAVYIPLPNNLHKDWTLKSLATGKHVLVEKPFAMNATEAQEMADASQSSGRLLMEAFMYRFHPRTQHIKQIIDQGELGSIRFIHSAFTFPVERDGSNERLFLPEMGGGSLWDVGCYGVSLSRWMLGEEPVIVSAQAIFSDDVVDISFIGTLRFASGALAVVESSFIASLQQTYSVIGSQGAIELPHDAYIPWEKDTTFILRQSSSDTGETLVDRGADEYRLMVENFADAVAGHTPLAYQVQESVSQMRVLDALKQAAKNGCCIDL
jgi:xylose dehydrogenase (NAD/NADP)